MAKKSASRPRVGRPAEPITGDSFAAAIGRRIRELRERRGLSVADCAALAGVAAPTWYHFERGRSIGLDKLPRIAAALGVKTSRLMPE